MNSYPPRTQQSCANCYYGIPVATSGRPHLICRYAAPQAGTIPHKACWPMVVNTDWCGFWGPSETEIEEAA
jgi:hypothetical protein